MNLRLWSAMGLFCLCLSAAPALGECTLRDKQALYDSGMSLYEIDKICGETRYKDDNRETADTEAEPVRPKGPDSHGRLQEPSNICQTDYLWCELSQSGPPGTPCRCDTRYGTLFGVVVRK